MKFIVMMLFFRIMLYSSAVDVVTCWDIFTIPQAFAPLRQKGYSVYQFWGGNGHLHTNKNAKNIIFFEVGDQIENYLQYFSNRRKAVLFLWEPYKRPETFYRYASCVYTWDDDLVDGVKFHKFYYPYLEPMIQGVVPFEQKKLCTMIVSNWMDISNPCPLGSTRREIAAFFESQAPEVFEYYGSPYKENSRSYRGRIPGHHSGEQDTEKIKTLSHYRFCICFENSSLRGYITEKIFGCFKAGCVPVYLGAPNITDYIPKDCFIDFRDFSTFDELHQFMESMSKERYQKYIDDIKAFLNSKKADVFKIDNFYKIFLEAVEL